jgi:menaquinone-specific isochorismate synthase
VRAASEWLGEPVDLARAMRGTDYLWVKDGEGVVGRGQTARLEIHPGSTRFRDAAQALEETFRSIDRDLGALPPVAFGSFTFDPEVSGSALVIPTEVVGSFGGRAWSLQIDDREEEARLGIAQEEVDAEGHDFKIRYAGSSISEVEWLEAVAEASNSIRRGDLEKVVLARDVLIWSRTELSLPVLVRRLSERFPQCFTFCFEGLVGATPELLVRRRGLRVESVVLAGTVARGANPDEDAALAGALLASSKDMAEHEPAVRSVLEVLGPVCSNLDVPTDPTILTLPNVQHLSTRITGTLNEPLSAMEIAGMLHPTAAVCGQPRSDALGFIREREGLDRARYSGPVGWVDANGDGEWGIALRCAEIDGARGRLFAGGGIVADSVPEDELEETRIKLRAMMSALESS